MSARRDVIERSAKLLGREVKLFTSSHERSHIMMAVGMAPAEMQNAPTKAVLVWEGALGRFYLLDENWSVTKEVTVLEPAGIVVTYSFSGSRIQHSQMKRKNSRKPLRRAS